MCVSVCVAIGSSKFGKCMSSIVSFSLYSSYTLFMFLLLVLRVLTGLFTYLTLFRTWSVTFPHLITHLDQLVFEWIQVHSLPHPEVFVCVVNRLWAEQVRIHGSTASCSLARHTDMQPGQINFFCGTVFVFIQYNSFLRYKTKRQ